LMLLFGCNNDKDPNPAPATSYFPPIGASTWERTEASSLGWNVEAINDLKTFLADNNTRAFLLLKDGKIVIEEYMGKQFDGATNFSINSNWYWASAGKTLTSALVGIAEGKGQLSLNDKTSKYLGSGWTSLNAAQEDKITIRHQVTMTSGLDDGVNNPDCTTKTCLTYKAEPGVRWAYHNAPYTLLDAVIAGATGKSLNNFLDEELKTKIGMDGQYIQTGDNNVYYSTARSMARFGVLLLNKGKWENEQIIPEEYFNEMTATSQNINLSYGYLTWLNGKSSFMIPKSQLVLTGSPSPNAPAEMFAAMGKNGQLINVVLSEGIVVIRMGDVPDNSLVPFTFQDDLWAKLNTVIR
jgi:CubicO group peptidase (beta-lactamase class C family)